MKILALAAMGSLAFGACQGGGAVGGGSLATQDDSVSYILGYKMGENLKQQSVPVKPELIFRGLKEGMAGTLASIPDSAMQATMMAFQVRMMGIQHQKDSVAAISNRTDGEKFLADNKGKDGVKTTPSGLQYKVLKEGTGPRPKATSTVTVNYKGTLIDGTKFDASEDHGGPASLLLNQMIPGWTEGLQLMNVGSKYEFWIPAELGWGPQGSPPTIPPNAVVYFEVELLSFK
ncbi:MAG TPA: FKBP-type peptidyl-prolyl cis-trans isomerase [Gemmatimonadales bacterium]|nr:FKBP-type peptidyl-prolyl cis-trans isomerase [Gemmatimonadales bacterium]